MNDKNVSENRKQMKQLERDMQSRLEQQGTHFDNLALKLETEHKQVVSSLQDEISRLTSERIQMTNDHEQQLYIHTSSIKSLELKLEKQQVSHQNQFNDVLADLRALEEEKRAIQWQMSDTNKMIAARIKELEICLDKANTMAKVEYEKYMYLKQEMEQEFEMSKTAWISEKDQLNSRLSNIQDKLQSELKEKNEIKLHATQLELKMTSDITEKSNLIAQLEVELQNINDIEQCRDDDFKAKLMEKELVIKDLEKCQNQLYNQISDLQTEVERSKRESVEQNDELSSRLEKGLKHQINTLERIAYEQELEELKDQQQKNCTNIDTLTKKNSKLIQQLIECKEKYSEVCELYDESIRCKSHQEIDQQSDTSLSLQTRLNELEFENQELLDTIHHMRMDMEDLVKPVQKNPVSLISSADKITDIQNDKIIMELQTVILKQNQKLDDLQQKFENSTGSKIQNSNHINPVTDKLLIQQNKLLRDKLERAVGELKNVNQERKRLVELNNKIRANIKIPLSTNDQSTQTNENKENGVGEVAVKQSQRATISQERIKSKMVKKQLLFKGPLEKQQVREAFKSIGVRNYNDRE
ncbi:hypothetical protein HDV02_003045 [Globomyces sp. JEL0801]|nr:hypothetical protein HDV02_003045 [Globomyces sp. JEL0801]